MLTAENEKKGEVWVELILDVTHAPILLHCVSQLMAWRAKAGWCCEVLVM